MKKIGILGGLGPEPTVSYYLYIVHEYYRRYRNFAYPEIIIYSLNLQEFVNAGYEIAWKVKEAINRLSDAGADFVVAACNSVHIVFDEVADKIPIPWISIIEVTGEEIKRHEIKKAGLLGTVFTMGKGFYAKGLARMGIETVLPDAPDMKRINDIIYNELVRKEVKEKSRIEILGIIDRLVQKGAEGIILGCTELPFLIRESDTSVKIFDTTVLHAKKALDIALEGKQ